MRFRKYYLKLVSITLVSIASFSWGRFASGNYLLKPYKWNKENLIISSQSQVRIVLGSCVRLKLGSYVRSTNYVVIAFGSYVRITLQKLRQTCVRKLRQINVRKSRNKTIQMGSKNYGVTTLKVTSGLRYKNHFRITSGSYVSITLQKSLQNYVRKLHQTSVKK